MSEKPKPWRGTPQRRPEDEMPPAQGRRACGLCLGTCVLPSRGVIAMISLTGMGFGVATQSWQAVCAWLVIISSTAAWPAVLYSLLSQWTASAVQPAALAHVLIQIREKRWTRRCHAPLCLKVLVCLQLAETVDMPSYVVSCILAPAIDSRQTETKTNISIREPSDRSGSATTH